MKFNGWDEFSNNRHFCAVRLIGRMRQGERERDREKGRQFVRFVLLKDWKSETVFKPHRKNATTESMKSTTELNTIQRPK